MNQNSFRFLMGVFVFILVAAGVTGCATVTAEPGTDFVCAEHFDVTPVISPEASLEDFSCMLKKEGGFNTMEFKVTLKNISSREQRFKVNIFLEEGKAVGGLIPRKTNKGLVKPGETASFVYPVNQIQQLSGNIDLIIKTMAP